MCHYHHLTILGIASCTILIRSARAETTDSVHRIGAAGQGLTRLFRRAHPGENDAVGVYFQHGLMRTGSFHATRTREAAPLDAQAMM